MSKTIIVLDYESGGLDPDDGAEPIELAAIAVDSDTLEEKGRFLARIMRVQKPENLSEGALKVNGKTVEQIIAGEDPAVVHQEFLNWAIRFTPAEDMALEPFKRNRPIPGGHNVPFDLKFLKWACRQYIPGGLKAYDQVFDYHFIDTFALGYPKKVLIEKSMGKGSLVNFTKYYNIPHQAHEAMGDVEATVEVLRRLFGEMRDEHKAYTEFQTALAKLEKDYPGYHLLFAASETPVPDGTVLQS